MTIRILNPKKYKCAEVGRFTSTNNALEGEVKKVKKLFALLPIVLFMCLALMPTVVGEMNEGTLYNKKLLITTTTDKPKYIVGEVVEMTLLVEQIRGRNTYTFMTSQRFDFELYRNNTLIWRWSNGMFFMPVIGYETLWRKDLSRSYTATWDSTGAAPGIYDLKGIWTCSEPLDHPCDWVQFELVA